tara:strand:- start:126 stop:533 length:408 start_codon:yes stop_codon:yes gene_type:complete
MVQKVINVSGSRKRAIARATIKEGTGKIRINKQLLSTIEPEISRLRIQEAIEIGKEYAKNANINIKIHGGGSECQIEAIRLALARAIFEFSKKNPQLKKDYLDYDRHLLVADVRRNEPHRPNDSKPRAKRQKSYR